MIVFLLLTTVSAASFSATSTVVSRDSIASLALTSPWAIAVSSSHNVYFSNFGSQDGVDFIGKFSVDNMSPTKYATIADIKIDGIKYAHVKHLAVATDSSGDTVFAAVYGGPTRTSYIVKCTGGSCNSIYKITDAGETQHYMPTAVAYSNLLQRVFFTLADGNQSASKIMSMKDDGSDVKTYLSQGASGVEYPVGLAIDDANKLVFWANDVGANKIQQGPLVAEQADAASVGTVLQDSSRPQNIAVDTKSRYVYFTDQTSSSNAVGRVRYGTGKYEATELLKDSLNAPNGIALDIENKFVYFAETGTSVIQRGTLDDLGAAAPGTKSAAVSNVAFSLSVIIAMIAVLFV